MAEPNVEKNQLEADQNILKQFVANQSLALQNNAKALELKQIELERVNYQVKTNQEIALKSIEAKVHVDDNKTKAERQKQNHKTVIILTLIISVVVIFFVTIIAGKDDLAKEILKYVGSAALGFFAGRGTVKKE